MARRDRTSNENLSRHQNQTVDTVGEFKLAKKESLEGRADVNRLRVLVLGTCVMVPSKRKSPPMRRNFVTSPVQTSLPVSTWFCGMSVCANTSPYGVRRPPPVGAEIRRDPFRTPPTEEKSIIEAALRECGGRVYGPGGAAEKLGIPRSTLESKIRTLKINKNRFRE